MNKSARTSSSGASSVSSTPGFVAPSAPPSMSPRISSSPSVSSGGASDTSVGSISGSSAAFFLAS